MEVIVGLEIYLKSGLMPWNTHCKVRSLSPGTARLILVQVENDREQGASVTLYLVFMGQILEQGSSSSVWVLF